jgi:pyridoxamine 5'-phosphate oxidase
MAEWSSRLDNCLKSVSLSLFSFATVDKSIPRVRTCVARSWLFNDRTTEVLLFTTDRRMAKFAQLEQDPQFEACFYFQKAGRQFRLAGSAFAFTDKHFPSHVDLGLSHPVTASQWKQEYNRVWDQLSKPMQLTFSKPPPGSPLTDEARKRLSDIEHSRLEPSQDNFVVVALRVTKVDYFEDEGTGRRTQYELQDGHWTAIEVCP